MDANSSTLPALTSKSIVTIHFGVPRVHAPSLDQMASSPSPHRFSITTFERMLQEGILTPDDRVELIDGLLMKKPSATAGAELCREKLHRLFEQDAVVSENSSVQCLSPVSIGVYSQPQPDVLLVRLEAGWHSAGSCAPDDVLLLVEIADGGLEYVRTLKIPLYALARIQEVWVVNLVDCTVQVYRAPTSNGQFGWYKDFGTNDEICAVAFPEHPLRVARIFEQDSKTGYFSS